MTIEITYKNTNRFVMLAGNLDHPEEMNEVLDFMDPLGVSVVESGDVTIESHGDSAEVQITLTLARASAGKTSAKKRKATKRKPRKKSTRAKASEAPPAYSEPPEEPEEPEADPEEAKAAARRFAKAQAAAATAKEENPETDEEDDGVDPLGDLEEALGGEADSQPF